MTDLKAIQERAEKAARAEADIETVYHWYIEDIPMLLKALAEAEGKLEGVEEWGKQHGGWTPVEHDEFLAILGGSK